MCDETTEAENVRFLEAARLTRREVGLGAGATAALLLSGCASKPSTTTEAAVPPPAPAPTTAAGSADAPPPAVEVAVEVTSRRVSIPAADGTAEGFFVAPKGKVSPGVLVWPDVAGLREAFETMATRLAQAGYAVLVVNAYYRSSPLPILKTFAEWRTDEGKAKIQPMREALTPERVAADGAAFVAWLDGQPDVDKGRKIGTTGYCMGGPFTFRTAAAAPGRVGVVGSFHGGGLVTPDAASPHRLLPTMKAAALVCIAQNDDERDPEAKQVLRRAADEAKVTAEIEVYPAQHGWCVTDSPVYDEAQAERAWARLLATLAAHL